MCHQQYYTIPATQKHYFHKTLGAPSTYTTADPGLGSTRRVHRGVENISEIRQEKYVKGTTCRVRAWRP